MEYNDYWNKAAEAHTHPIHVGVGMYSPKPSTIANSADEKQNDEYSSRIMKIPIYVVTDQGIWKITPTGVVTQEEDEHWIDEFEKDECE
ncbi:MAG: hypothetical protein GX660_26060 [Clostridiaceae bacterium]|nr:hypothetical protein [Clostridiaceae bacterium]